MSNLVLFDYKGSKVTFEIGGEIYVNATEMAKPFNKLVKDFLRTGQTKEFLQVLENERGENNPNVDNQKLIKVVQGGNVGEIQQGTWLHEDVAMEFARWLSPEFAIWCNRKIKELLTTGKTTLDIPEGLPDFTNPAIAARAWAEQFEKRELAEAKYKEIDELLTDAEPFIEFAISVSNTSDTVDMGQFAKLAYSETKLGRNNMFDMLRRHKILMSGANNNIPYQSYIDNGWFKVVEQPYSTPYGDKISIKTLVTGKGQIGLIETLKSLIKKQGIE